MSERLFFGTRQFDGCKVLVVADGAAQALPTSPRPGRNFAAGWEWGYGGSGPAQLAHDLAVFLFGQGDAARAATKVILREYLAKQEGDRWSTSEADLKTLCAAEIVDLGAPIPEIPGGFKLDE